MFPVPSVRWCTLEIKDGYHNRTFSIEHYRKMMFWFHIKLWCPSMNGFLLKNIHENRKSKMSTTEEIGWCWTIWANERWSVVMFIYKELMTISKWFTWKIFCVENTCNINERWTWWLMIKVESCDTLPLILS